jgi:hypothetical protein
MNYSSICGVYLIAPFVNVTPVTNRATTKKAAPRKRKPWYQVGLTHKQRRAIGQEVATKHGCGVDVRELASEYGMATDYVYHLCRKYGKKVVATNG